MGRHTPLGPPPAVGVDGPVFRRLLQAWGVSVLGDGVRMVALPLVAALLTGSPLAVAAVAAAELVPWLLLAVPVGALVDRADARTVLLRAHLARAGLSVVLVVALLQDAGSVALLCALAFVLTVAETFADAASQVLLVAAAGHADLVGANTRVRTVESLVLHLVGPLLGGVLVAVEPALAFAVDGATFLVAAALVASLPSPRTAPVAPGGPAASLLGEVREGLAALVQVPGLRVLVGVTAWTSLATGGVEAVATLYALQVLALPVALVPLVVVLQAVGLLVGARLVGVLAARWGEGAVMTLALTTVGGAYVLMGLVPRASVVLGCYLLTGVGFALWNVLASARRQLITPEGLLGRVSGASRALTWGAMPLGALLAGVLATTTSLAAVHVAAGLLVLGVAVLARRALGAAAVSVPGAHHPAAA